MNKRDSEVLASILTASGYESTDDSEQADIILINTCSVRDTAERKILGRLERLKQVKQDRPNMILGVCGCMAQSWGEKLVEQYPHVDIVLGTHRLANLPQLIRQRQTQNAPAVDVSELDSDADMMHSVRDSSISAWVTIMHGCNNFCTYCIVPYVRGRERSRSVASILQEVRSLDEAGFREITLLGQNVNSYGLDNDESVDFAGLLGLIDRESGGIQRIRFTTSHPKDVSHRLMDAVAELPKVCKNFHLPAQAGSNSVLKRMNRGYTREYYLDTVRNLRERVPDISITTDLIVGFPGETEEDFRDTMDLVQEVQFDVAFCFRYSPRRDTPAAIMEDQVPEEVKMRRLHELLELQDSISIERNRALIGTVQEVLVDGINSRDRSQVSGRTNTNKIVFFPGSAGLIGETVAVEITDTGNWSLRGRQLSEEETKVMQVSEHL